MVVPELSIAFLHPPLSVTAFSSFFLIFLFVYIVIAGQIWTLLANRSLSMIHPFVLGLAIVVFLLSPSSPLSFLLLSPFFSSLLVSLCLCLGPSGNLFLTLLFGAF